MHTGELCNTLANIKIIKLLNMNHSVKNFKYVNYLWEESKAEALGDDQVELFLYRSNILGADLRITNYGGGNTSCKTVEKDPLTNEEVEVMWIKGSGGDIGTLNKAGIAGLYTERLRNLKNVYGGLADEDRMVGLLTIVYTTWTARLRP